MPALQCVYSVFLLWEIFSGGIHTRCFHLTLNMATSFEGFPFLTLLAQVCIAHTFWNIYR